MSSFLWSQVFYGIYLTCLYVTFELTAISWHVFSNHLPLIFIPYPIHSHVLITLFTVPLYSSTTICLHSTSCSFLSVMSFLPLCEFVLPSWTFYTDPHNPLFRNFPLLIVAKAVLLSLYFGFFLMHMLPCAIMPSRVNLSDIATYDILPQLLRNLGVPPQDSFTHSFIVHWLSFWCISCRILLVL